ncbi:hypothetical protein RhiirC2_802561 [Rhizophagus irregularis]|uniref:Uncharacterized protein n=1 Tax=Rhizophagus irregularis TaxID=588596 RepID=A0A2N1M165_9GLOM|nr:hypothetical protein RhiirC2_802561 [Rhizophagus irregularis]
MALGQRAEALKHDYEEENNRRVINELKVLSQHLLDYNRQTFGKFMQDIEKDYRERVSSPIPIYNHKKEWHFGGLIQGKEEHVKNIKLSWRRKTTIFIVNCKQR